VVVSSLCCSLSFATVQLKKPKMKGTKEKQHGKKAKTSSRDVAERVVMVIPGERETGPHKAHSFGPWNDYTTKEVPASNVHWIGDAGHFKSISWNILADV
jgi:hypothetical protein